MDDTPVVLGINRTQGASIGLMHGSHLDWAIQKERLTRRKHHWGQPGDLREHYLPPCSSCAPRPASRSVQAAGRPQAMR